MRKTYYCPTADIECPYCVDVTYECVIGDPEDECTDYYYYSVEREEDEDDVW
jgi:hypothetical protein